MLSDVLNFQENRGWRAYKRVASEKKGVTKAKSIQQLQRFSPLLFYKVSCMILYPFHDLTLVKVSTKRLSNSLAKRFLLLSK